MLPLLTLLCFPVLQEEPLQKAFDGLRVQDKKRRLAAEEQIRAAGKAALPFALRALEGGDPGVKKRVDLLVKKLSLPSWEERDRAMRDLIEIGFPVLSLLEDHYGTPDPEVSWRLRVIQARLRETIVRGKEDENRRKVFLLEVIGNTNSRKAVPLLLEYLEDPEFAIQIAAARSLSRLVGLMKKTEVDATAGRVVDLLRGRTRALDRARLVRILGRLGAPVSVKPLAGLLLDQGEPDVHLLRNVLVALSKIGTAAALHAVICCIDDARLYIRYAAQQVLEEISGRKSAFDPRGGNKDAATLYRKWWEEEFGKSWTEK